MTQSTPTTKLQAARLARGWKAELGLSDARYATITAAEEFGFPKTRSQGVQQLAETWRWDMERRDFLRSVAFAVTASATPVLRWLFSDPESIRADGKRLVGAPHIDLIHGMTKTFRAMDNRYGGGHARESVVLFLRGDVQPLLTEGSFNAKIGKELLSATAEMTQLVGWMSYD